MAQRSDVGWLWLPWTLIGVLLCSLACQGLATADSSGGAGNRKVLRGTRTDKGTGRKLNAARMTWNSCKCKEQWEMDGVGKCKDSCCNLDNDTLGEWCMVQEESCEESDWGYCRPKGEMTTCRDSPTGWTDVEGDRCGDYAMNQYCTADGEYGKDWDKSWGTFYDFANQGHSAITACCVCGGGIDALDHCTDKPDWQDADGDTCSSYLNAAWCDITGDYGVGWHEEWGTFADASNKGMSAVQACCACGGGDSSIPATSGVLQSHAQHFTLSGCECKQDWIDEITGKPCHGYCCNPDGDPNGDWCYVKNSLCEDADWGYCRGEGPGDKPCLDSPPAWVDADGDGCWEYEDQNLCTASGGSGSGWKDDWGTFDDYWNDGHTAITACCACGGGGDRAGFSSFNRECRDKTGWNDTDGDTCAAYADDGWCTSTGGYGWGWHEEWGTFADHSKQMSAPQACCACGGGSSTNFQAPPGAQGLARSPAASGAPSPPPASASSAARQTWNGCACKKSWSESDLSCNNYCCNPDDDEYGNWCFVKDENCEESSWGYCQPVGGDAEHGSCTDLAGWTDAEGDGCWVYGDSGWCNSDGTPGAKWDSSWGLFADFFSEGHSAASACCACGGGTRTEAAAACTDIANWKDPDGDGCGEYMAYKWCSSTGGFGIGWHEEWGNFRGEPTAARACCYCGGGGAGGSGTLTATGPGSARNATPPSKSSNAGAIAGVVVAIVAIVVAGLVAVYVYKNRQAQGSDMPKVGGTRIGRKYETVGEDL